MGQKTETGGKIVHVNQKEGKLDCSLGFYGRSPDPFNPSSVMRYPEASRAVAENHIFSREALAYRRHKSSALCYDPENAQRVGDTPTTGQTRAGRVSARGNAPRCVADMQNRRFLSFTSIDSGNISTDVSGTIRERQHCINRVCNIILINIVLNIIV